MHFAHPLPWWAVPLVAAAIGALAYFEYRRPLAPLSRARRGVLAGARALALAALVVFLLRPIGFAPPSSTSGAIVPILVDVSRSMRLDDADHEARLARAVALVRTTLLPSIARHFKPEIYSVGDRLAPATLDRLSADAPRSDLSGALAAVAERYRGQQVAGVVLVSDGGDTGRQDASIGAAAGGPAVFAVGVGSPDGVRDREVIGVTAGDPRLDQASVDLHVSATSSGYGREPFQLGVLENGRPLDSRRVVPPADGSPIDEVFTVLPDPLTPTVYTAEIPADERERVTENNARSVLVSPAGRKRRILMVEGAPGFEHSFIRRALEADPDLDVDSVVRKGRNADGRDTFLVQASASRTASLLNGFPSRRDDLYAYDAVIVANVEGDFFTRAQLAMTADFVSERGGGLLVLGGRSFAERGLIGTPLEDVLPVELNDRHGGLARAAFDVAPGAPFGKLIVTAEGEDHPVMRIGSTPEETRQRWAALPPLAASSPVGAPRPGATVLAVTPAPGGVRPLVAVQRYGRGRSMVFAGEASWRWKMMVSSTNRSHEFFWRQAARWLAGPAPDPVAIAVPEAPGPGDTIAVEVDARDPSFAPVPDATVDATITVPGGDVRPLGMRHDGTSGRYAAAVRVEQPGLFKVHAEARRGATPLGEADRWFYVGGADRESADPRLNEAFLRRVARASGGRYVRGGEAGRVAAWLQSAVPSEQALERRDLWHEPWAFALVVFLLCGEWVLRRRWGLR